MRTIRASPRRSIRGSEIRGRPRRASLDANAALAQTLTFSAAVGATTALTALTTNANVTAALNGASVTTSAATGQVYNGPVTLGADTTLTAGTGAITFGGTVNGGFNLTTTSSGFRADAR